MFKTILPALSALITLITWWLVFSQTKSFWWLLALTIVVLLWTARRIAGRLFWSYRLAWLNIVLVYLSQTLFLLLLKSSNMRFGLAFWLALLWGLIWWWYQQYFRKAKALLRPDYLVFNRFWYYLSFWFLASGIYALYTFINLSLYLTVAIIVLVGFAFLAELLLRERLFDWRILILWLWLFLQICAIISLLPISFYLAGTLATLWYFFLAESWLNVGHSLRWYFILLVLAHLFILVATLFYI